MAIDSQHLSISVFPLEPTSFLPYLVGAREEGVRDGEIIEEDAVHLGVAHAVHLRRHKYARNALIWPCLSLHSLQAATPTTFTHHTPLPPSSPTSPEIVGGSCQTLL